MMKYIISILAGIAVGTALLTAPTHAFNPGRIIDDGVFTEASSMNIPQIQQFLNSKVPTCDTWGTQPSEFGGGTRRQWAEARGYSAPFTCLRDYVEHGKSAAQIIFEISNQYGISPKVLIVLLQKEQSLVTDTWPLSKQYRTATGYGCPDTAPCDVQYYGFTNQLNKAAYMFRSILNASPTWYTPYILGNNFIRYSPDASCGGSNVTIQNRSTQALYNYTPYQPNAGALAAGWGTAPCGAYGNRNFYLYFTNWFGSTTAAASYGYSVITREFYSDAGYQNRISDTPTVEPNSTFYVRLTVKNTGNQVWQKDTLRLGGQNPQDRWSPFATDGWIGYGRPAGMNETTVGENANATFTFKMKAPAQLGSYQETFGVLVEGNRWLPGTFTLPITVASSAPYYAYQRPYFDVFTDSAMTQKVNPLNVTVYPSSKVYVRMVIKNIGNQPLPANLTKVATANPLNRVGPYADGSWPSANRAATTQEGTIAPGQSGTFVFSLTAPASPTARTNEQFGLLIEGDRWITENLATVSIQTVTRPPVELSMNQSLEPGQSLVSSNERYKLILQGDGNIVLYSPTRALWSSGTVGTGGVRLIMQTDGNLVLYRSNWTPVWSTNSGGHGSKLVLQIDGNLVVYNSSWRPTWNTATSGQ